MEKRTDHQKLDDAIIDVDIEVDVKQSLLINLPWFLFTGLAVLYFYFMMRIITELFIFTNTSEMRLGLTIILIFSILKIFSWVGFPDIHYKYRAEVKDVRKER